MEHLYCYMQGNPGKKGYFLTECVKEIRIMLEGINREYKDRLFKFIFGSPENKEWTLSLYNAINNSDYTDPREIEFNTIEDAVYMSMKNDVSFLVGNTVNFYEQQSTYNPNMPVRFWIYSAMAYSNYINSNHLRYRILGGSLQKLPTPKCVCFYNGSKDMPDRTVLKLSDSFADDMDPDVELKVTMVNVNCGHNERMMSKCKPLSEYSWFVGKVRDYKGAYAIKQAVNKAIDEMPAEFLIKSFLLKNRAEVTGMCITEYDEMEAIAEFKKMEREEGREEGRKEGRKEGLEEGRKEGLEEGRKEGREIAIKQFGKLAIYLVKQGMTGELEKASNDVEYSNELLKKYNIE